MAKSASSSNNEDAIVIDVRPLLQPVATIIAAIMISGAILISGGTGGSKVAGTTTTGTDTTATPPAAVDPNPTTATVSIDDDPFLGNKDTAKIAIVEFSDYECPFCQRFHGDTLPEIIQTYVDSGQAILVYRDLPLTSIHPNATTYAKAANCARKQGGDSKYFEMHDEIFVNAANGVLSVAKLGDLASEIGLNKGQLESCTNSDEFDDEIAKDIADANAIGIGGTPGFVVGPLAADGTVTGDVISGAYPFATFQTSAEKYL